MSQLSEASEKPAAVNFEKVAKVVLDKSKAKREPKVESDDLPSYLKIDLSEIIIKDPV